MRTIICLHSCAPGYNGDICQNKDPCYGNPCGEGTCIVVPEHLGTLFDNEYYCICHIANEGTCTEIQIINSTGVTCNHNSFENNHNCTRQSCGGGRGACLSCNMFGDTGVVCVKETDLRRGFTCV